MTKALKLILSVLVATALLLPATVHGQASRRGGGDSGGSSSGSRGGDSGGSVAQPRNSPAPAPAPAQPSRVESGERSSAPRGGRVSERPAGSNDAPAARAGSGRRVFDDGDGTGRVRTSQAVRGSAQARGDVPRPRPSYPGYWNPWNYYGSSYYSPWYYYGPYAYSPWVYGSWAFSPYGWHDPYLYDPFGYGGGAPYYWPSAGSGSRDRDDDDGGLATGSLRLRVSPSNARVYVDGALAGSADEFGGFSNHLSLPEGRHQLELRADGHETRTLDVTVKAGRTQTERISLKKLP